jgi:hypothetical protein
MPFISAEHHERVKAEAKSQVARIGALGAAGAAGFAVSFLNTRMGGTQTAPYLIAGKVPIDLAAAGAAAVALITCRKAHHLPYIAGAAGAAMGLVGARYGATLEPQLSSHLAGILPGASPSVAGIGRPRIGVLPGSTGHGQHARQGRAHGEYGAAPNPYLSVAR